MWLIFSLEITVEGSGTGVPSRTAGSGVGVAVGMMGVGGGGNVGDTGVSFALQADNSKTNTKIKIARLFIIKFLSQAQ